MQIKAPSPLEIIQFYDFAAAHCYMGGRADLFLSPLDDARWVRYYKWDGDGLLIMVGLWDEKESTLEVYE